MSVRPDSSLETPFYRVADYRRVLQKAVVLAIGLAYLGLLQGCAQKQPETAISTQIDIPPNGKISLAVEELTDKLDIPGTGRSVEIGRGARVGFQYGAAGVYCGYAAIICIPVLATVGTVGGAVYGAAAADSSSEWQDTENLFAAIIAEMELDKNIAQETAAYANAHGYLINDPTSSPESEDKASTFSASLNNKEFWAHLNIKDISIILLPAELEVNPPRQFTIQAQVSLIRTSDGSLLAESVVSDSLGPVRRIDEWREENAKHFREEVPYAIQRLSERIVEDFFMRQQLPLTITPTGLLMEAHIKGPRTLFPASTHRYAQNIDSLQPTMRWEPVIEDNATYDLRIWSDSENNDLRIWSDSGNKIGAVVYQRDGLVDAWHTLTTPLEPATTYFFSMRAHFTENGRGRVSEWSRYSLNWTTAGKIMSYGVNYLFPEVKPYSFYRFITPD